MALITCKEVKMGYEGKIILDNVNFTVNQGDYLCIIGENGSGKSTLMKGLLKLKSALGGKIGYGEGLVANQIGYLPQQTDIQRNFPASVYEVVLSGRLNQLGWRPFFNNKDKKVVLEKMEWMGIKHLKGQSFQELSGGQQQRVLLARALCATQKLLLLDEPVAGLDPVVTAEMYDLIKTINEKHDITVIMISHDIEAAVKYASHILQLGNKQLYFGTTKDYLNSDIGRTFVGGGANA
ncbi:metal ABC transporter ATP-binding protein [Cellulosilyticum lentocellum]|uniref:Phosphonate-transporting ATPase n=1 Tax=Cellulosilyticum lentocellum (strain ATCC 49066 / DSM 5427 / NCIMB 11756 / RHM5) TaxID=642492 RepID=F2JQG0_CELLD|nr:ABC transporter ATP-binding protein [Cellulosilyticum lentocellum]ADZ84944.1 Phosphonate-transporting ATPase [Cellulosilyticum lentocellum DSM 5427]